MYNETRTHLGLGKGEPSSDPGPSQPYRFCADYIIVTRGYNIREGQASGEKKYIDGACVLTDGDGDQIFSTFDTRDTDKSQPKMDCGTHIITGGTGKYKGITGSEPFACINMPALAGPGGYTAMDIPHNTAWEIK